MAFLLGPALGALGSLLFKSDGGKVGTPALKSARLAEMTGKSNMVSQPYMKSFPKMKKMGGVVQKKRKGGKIKK
jgi:hypothetical protein